jgi:uncharacterized surface anchored protein
MLTKRIRMWSFAVAVLVIAAAAAVVIPASAQEGSSLTVFKVNPLNQPLAGATFVLMPLGTMTPSNGPVVTDMTGHATFTGVADGKFTLHETSAPPGFTASADIVVDIPAQNQQFVKDTFAAGTGNLEIFKASTTARTTGLAGARFTATNEQTGEVFALEFTDSHGFVTFPLPAGSFTVHETIAPQGFGPAPDVTGVIVLSGQTTDITVLDSPTGGGVEGTGLSSLTVFKVNPNDQPLAGATFVLMPLGSSTVASGPVVTDGTGHATFVGVVPGKFTLHETAAPPGFVPSADIVVDIGTSPAQQFVKDTFAPGNGSLEIFKASTSAPSVGLGGARFTATNEQTGAVFTLEFTDSHGFVTGTVPAGSFTVHETIAPQGFAPAGDMKGVIVFAGQTTDITILDVPAGNGVSGQGTSSLTIFKVGPDNQALAGATFVLMPLGSTMVASGPVTTDATGHATFSGVVPGKFTLHETSAPTGFMPSADIIVDVGATPAQQFVVDQRSTPITTTTTTTGGVSPASTVLLPQTGGGSPTTWLLGFAGLQLLVLGVITLAGPRRRRQRSA